MAVNKGGRPKGSTTKRGLGAVRRIREKFPDYDPLLHLAEIANDPDAEPSLRMSASKEVACYQYPKLKSTEITGPGGGAIKHNVKISFVNGD